MSRKKNHNVHATFASSLSLYSEGFEAAVAQMNEALSAQKAGTWSELRLEIDAEEDDYHFVSIIGYRDETEKEKERRLINDAAHLAFVKDQERKEYERLKAKYEAPNE